MESESEEVEGRHPFGKQMAMLKMIARMEWRDCGQYIETRKPLNLSAAEQYRNMFEDVGLAPYAPERSESFEKFDTKKLTLDKETALRFFGHLHISLNLQASPTDKAIGNHFAAQETKIIREADMNFLRSMRIDPEGGGSKAEMYAKLKLNAGGASRE